MPWGKMDDKFHRNRKVRELRRSKAGREALGAWVYWWSWCLDDPELTGFVPEEQLSPADLKSAETLVGVGLWEQVEGGFVFHDFTEYNPTREGLARKREADRTRIAAKREATRIFVERESRATFSRVASSRPVPFPIPEEERREEGESPNPLEHQIDLAEIPKIEPPLWLKLHVKWTEIVYRGVLSSSPANDKRYFEPLAKACEARRPKDPVGLFAEVLTRYVSEKRARGKEVHARYFCEDFAEWAEQKAINGKPVKPPIVLEYEQAKAQYASAEKAGDAAAQERLANHLRTLGKRMSGHA